MRQRPAAALTQGLFEAAGLGGSRTLWHYTPHQRGLAAMSMSCLFAREKAYDCPPKLQHAHLVRRNQVRMQTLPAGHSTGAGAELEEGNRAGRTPWGTPPR